MYSPFTLKISPMDRLCLINFEKDPDEIYTAFEPQWFEDPTYGTGLRVIAWRKDGFVDVYQQPNLTREEQFDVAAKGLADTVIRTMDDARFQVTAKGLDVAFSFEDKSGRRVDVEVAEQGRKPVRPFSILAPVGSSSVKPSSLPAYFMFRFAFVRRRSSTVSIHIGSRQHQADAFPLPIHGSKVYYLRYSADTFLVDWCPALSQELELLQEDGKHCQSSDGTQYKIDVEDGSLSGLSARRGDHLFNASFEPPFPEITAMAEKTHRGNVALSTEEESTGSILGTYETSRQGQTVKVTLRLDGGWVPRPKALFLKILFRVAKIFRDWPRAYCWTATIQLKEDDLPFMQSKWMRVE